RPQLCPPSSARRPCLHQHGSHDAVSPLPAGRQLDQADLSSGRPAKASRLPLKPGYFVDDPTICCSNICQLKRTESLWRLDRTKTKVPIGASLEYQALSNTCKRRSCRQTG